MSGVLGLMRGGDGVEGLAGDAAHGGEAGDAGAKAGEGVHPKRAAAEG